MDFLPPDIDAYVAAHTSPESELLAELNRDTHLKTLYPRMLSGHVQGRILSMISHMIRPKRVLEIGTFTGYSCLCLAEGLPEDGKIISLELNPELEFMIRPRLIEAGIEDQVELVFGDAMTNLESIEGPFDLVFIDADKARYPIYYERVLPKVRTGGFLLVDNVLWSGKITDLSVKDKETTGIRAFNDLVTEDDRVEQVLLPVRDGMMLVRKR
ncbi:O-methyltransferase [Pontibacter sp. G13]|uniref:O-methyltransferase n=1 Tax=Pontibacter sp. G13 TaxID=3074898 RepID=UPI00288BAB54|nr:O-methyltransferase [Pontibacter sp. G13]WNJ21215.1 O-methyltransferase [Pontibacter sp. G13]